MATVTNILEAYKALNGRKLTTTTWKGVIDPDASLSGKWKASTALFSDDLTTFHVNCATIGYY